MTRFVVGDDRSQSTLFPERLDDYLGEDNPAPGATHLFLLYRGGTRRGRELTAVAVQREESSLILTRMKIPIIVILRQHFGILLSWRTKEQEDRADSLPEVLRRAIA